MAEPVPDQDVIINASYKIGNFFRDFRAIVRTLGIYVMCSLLTWFALWLAFTPPNKPKAFKVTYELATGGSPFNFDHLWNSVALWLQGWLLLFHILSWLLIPILAATAVDGALRLSEERRRKDEETLREFLVDAYVKAGISENEAKAMAAEKLRVGPNVRPSPSRDSLSQRIWQRIRYWREPS